MGANNKNREAAGLAGLFTDDCVRMPDSGPATTGREALESAYRREFAAVWNTRF
jgi:ketosteroid isomerase-like protein